MNCNAPFVMGMQLYPCGQCIPCRVNRRRIWAHRILLESKLHEDNCFLTLTYDNEHLPYGGSLEPEHLRNFLKRFRKRLAPARIRFYAVGEYGEQSNRPHYHAAIFGYPNCDYGNTRKWRSECCEVCSVVSKCWGMGDIDVGDLSAVTANYVAGYVTKKMTRYDDPRLEGRHPEFGRMSLRPGIGFGFVHELASDWMRYDMERKLVDVPVAIGHGTKQMPLGRYLRKAMRRMVGRDEKTPQAVIDENQTRLRALSESAKFDEENVSFKSQVLAATKGKRASIERRQSIFKQRRTI